MAIVTPGVVPASVLLAEPRPAWLKRFAEAATTIRFGDFDADLSAQARLVVLDCLGAIAAGMQEPEMRALTARLARRGGRVTAPAVGAG